VRRLEIAAMFAAGASPLALAKPIVIAGLIAASAYAVAVETLVPPTAGRTHEVRRRMGLPGETRPGRNSWFKGSNRLYRVQSLDDPTGARLRDVLVLELDAGRLIRRWDIAMLSYDEGRWVGSNVIQRDLRPGKGSGMQTVDSASAQMDLRERPEDFVTNIAAPSRLSYRMLARTTEARERLGRPALEHRIELYRRHATPVIVLLTMLVAGAVAMVLGRRQTLAGALGAGAAVGFSAWIMQELFRLVGTAGALSAGLATHSVVALLVVAAVTGWVRVVRRGVAEA
jgi:lipopolysaccharide export LptBFGC system permease protein LptF